jgi:hypothetical protein
LGRIEKTKYILANRKKSENGGFAYGAQMAVPFASASSAQAWEHPIKDENDFEKYGVISIVTP